MPRFHFDIHEDDRFIRDDEGQDFANVESARNEALAAGAAIAHDAFVTGSADHIVVDVRENDDAPIVTVSIKLDVEE